jgi:hypothetical protein
MRGTQDSAYIVFGRANVASQITLSCFFNTSIITFLLSLNNPSVNSKTLTIIPLASGICSVSVSIVIFDI